MKATDLHALAAQTFLIERTPQPPEPENAAFERRLADQSRNPWLGWNQPRADIRSYRFSQVVLHGEYWGLLNADGFILRTGYLPQGPIQYPPLGSLVAKELGSKEAALPNFVSIAPFRVLSPAAFTPGFLGPMHAPLVVGDTSDSALVTETSPDRIRSIISR